MTDEIPISLNEYQKFAQSTAIYPTDGEVAGVPAGILYNGFGAVGEAGEIAEKIKKAIREDEDEYLDEVVYEMGDVLWYLAMLADELDMTLREVAAINIEKLSDRAERDVITGKGDHR